MNVLSLFDGMNCGQIALNRAGFKIENYFACEIDKYAIQVTQANYPNTQQLGDVTKVSALDLPSLDLVIGGSPCQGFSFAGKQLNFEDQRSRLFFEFVRLLKEARVKNPEVKFLLENVLMKNEYKEVISEILGVKPIEINSALLSAQSRSRLYWTNCEGVEQPKDKKIVLGDILELEVAEKYYYDKPLIKIDLNKQVCAIIDMKNQDMHKRVFNPNSKVHTLTACGGGNTEKKVLIKGRARKLTPLEYERAQTVPDNYTARVSNSQRYKMLGNGWTVDIIAHILQSDISL